MGKKIFGEGRRNDAWDELKNAYDSGKIVIVTYVGMGCNCLCIEEVGVTNILHLPDLNGENTYTGFMPEGYN